MRPHYLLDTCALLALQDSGKALSRKVRSMLEGAESKVFVSSISAFEIGQKSATRRLTLPCPLDQWFPSMLKHHLLTEAPVTATISITATSLPPIHKDPFDRIIIATAMKLGVPIITSDQMIPSYPGILTYW